ncbi:MAG: aldo/keto reductase [Solirubrobacteraceae bacterium]
MQSPASLVAPPGRRSRRPAGDVRALTSQSLATRGAWVGRWHMQHAHIAIPESARPERMAENINVFDFELAPEQMTAIDALDKGESGRVGPNPDTYEGV